LVNRTLAANQLTMGSMVQWFEKMFAAHLNVKHVITCSSGTTALHLALVAAGIGEGDEVLVPNVTYVATANAVTYTGARPVLVDIDPLTWTIDVHDAEAKITSRTRAIIPVHLYGNPCDMDAIRFMAERNGLAVIEDAAEAIGASWRGHKCGTLGLMGCFSFYANKVITTGEGGAVATNDDVLASKLRLYRGQGQDPTRRYYHPVVGFNYRMTDMQAAIGVAQMHRLPELLKARRVVEGVYYEILENIVGEPLRYPGDCTTAPWLFTFCLDDEIDREDVMRQLAGRGIETRPTFVPLHRLPPYASAESFPVSDLAGDQGLSLPTHADMTPEDAAFIANEVREVLS
jgi:perosamine synthetase